ncbi:hypothetical protein [Legionella spiritensis]|uniref:hypothetical protein n=1 Tax=Legionella spiritensis TaxID=452 RepID=UPI000F6EBF84|nr:hypothetical protein [Legionella spiritensis]VEG91118.1 Uncharacterised protein [Legionella spiritensis]
MLLSRQEFVAICSQAIIKTRKNIDIENQLSGYNKFHREIKENSYLETQVRDAIYQLGENEHILTHDIIEHTGLGRCHELAQYLIVEIAEAINQSGARARISIVSSEREDHVYLEIKIKLRNERSDSRWEVDAWDPRIIDISTRPDGSIKNRKSLHYGYAVEICDMVFTDQIKFDRKRKRQREEISLAIKKPLPGKPDREATPEQDILNKHSPYLYPDLTLENAYKKKRLNTSGQLHYLQHASFWQKSHEKKSNRKNKTKISTEPGYCAFLSPPGF